jgi:type VI secretion system protein ImpA
MDANLDIEALLIPISPDHPSGEDLRYADVYDRVKEARRADDLLDQGEWRTDTKTADWRSVITLCSLALKEQTKDLQLGVWLTEALVHQHGYDGLANGLVLIRRLLQDFWPTLHPLIDEGDMDYRIGPLTLLSEKLPDALRRVPVCDPHCSKGYDLFQWEESLLVGFSHDLDKEQRKRRQLLIDEGKISAEDFASAVNAGSLGFYQGALAHLSRCRTALLDLDKLVTEKFAPDPPGFRQLMEAVEACAHLIGRIFKEKQKSEITPQEDIEVVRSDQESHADPALKDEGAVVESAAGGLSLIQRNAISDISVFERGAWKQVSEKLSKGLLKPALDQLLSAAALAPSVREKNRYQLLVAKLCLKAGRADLATPIVEQINTLIDTLKLEQWEHPAWIADVVETLYRCLVANEEVDSERSKLLFKKLCMLNVSKAAAYRSGG